MILKNVDCQGFPVLIPSYSERKWALREDFSFWVNDIEYIIPAGFTTDFASVWGPIRVIVPQWGRYGVGTIIHDYCYRTGLFDRKTCDLIFKEIMTIYGTDAFRKHLMYISVRLFGWMLFNREKYYEQRTNL